MRRCDFPSDVIIDAFADEDHPVKSVGFQLEIL